MSEELHGYLRHERERIKTALDGFRSGQLEVWDISAGRKNVSHEHIEQLEGHLSETEKLMRMWEVPFDA